MTLHTVVLILHVLGATLVVGSVVFSLSLLLRRPFLDYSRQLLAFAWRMAEVAVGVQFLTGLYLYFNEREEFENNHLFWAKMILYVLAGMISVGVIKRRMKTLATATDVPAAARRMVVPMWLIIVCMVALVSIAVVMVETLP